VPTIGAGEASGPAGILPSWFIDFAPIALAGLAARALCLKIFDFLKADASMSPRELGSSADSKKKKA